VHQHRSIDCISLFSTTSSLVRSVHEEAMKAKRRAATPERAAPSQTQRSWKSPRRASSHSTPGSISRLETTRNAFKVLAGTPASSSPPTTTGRASGGGKAGNKLAWYHQYWKPKGARDTYPHERHRCILILKCLRFGCLRCREIQYSVHSVSSALSLHTKHCTYKRTRGGSFT
jgi:hypothetical protein